MKTNIVWTIAGSDCSGGAGIQADLHTFQNMGVHGCSVITAITSQNSQVVNEIYYLSPKQVLAQINALNSDMAPQSIKLGMLGHSAVLQKMAGFLHDFSGTVIMDPILYSSSGKNLFLAELHDYLISLKLLFPCIDLLTPNIPEAELILNRSILSYKDILHAANDILELGVKSVLIKGGHFTDAMSQDYWTNGSESFWMGSPRGGKNYHGTGCALSAAVTAAVANGFSLPDALIKGKMYLNRGIRLAYDKGLGDAYLSHRSIVEHETDLPSVSSQPILKIPCPFKDCGSMPLGLYPVVNRAHWLEKLLPLGVTTIQLRIKDLAGKVLAAEIKQAIKIADQYKARLFINDYWQQAIQFDAYGVHLGQNDLATADLEKIRQAGLRLGISTHSDYEMARAVACYPSYIAFGPIYATTSKVMPFMPQGLDNLRRWRQILNFPVVAIGGINLTRLPEVLATGISGIAMISAITEAADPLLMTQSLLRVINEYP